MLLLRRPLCIKCPKTSDYKVCSICAKQDHTYKNCLSQEKVCINCKGAHSTLALSCPYRKKLIKDTSSASTKRTYAAASITDKPTAMANVLSGTIELIAKSVMCVVVSALKNAEAPGTFSETMHHLLRANNLPEFSLGDITPPTMQSSSQLREEFPTSSPTVFKDKDPGKLITHDSTIYKKKSVPAVSAENIESLYRNGDIILECDIASATDCIRHLSLATPNDFKRQVNVIELKDKVYDQRVMSAKSSAKRSLRSISNNQ